MEFGFNDAIQAHRDWKTKLTEYLPKADGSLSPEEIRRDDRCKLGQWLCGEGLKYKQLPEFTQLKARHADFHEAAAEVVLGANSGHSVSVDVAVGPNSKYAKASASVVVAIMQLRDRR